MPHDRVYLDRLVALRELVDEGVLGGAEDGVLTVHEYRWLAFWAWVRAQEPDDELIMLDPDRERELFERIKERIDDD